MNRLINHFKCKPIICLLLYFVVSSIHPGAQAKTKNQVLVLPFKVTPTSEKAHQWLGRAVSYYIASGLQLNGLTVMPDQYTVVVLERNHIMFPYNITKASVIRLARENQFNRVVWGEIISGGSETGAVDKAMLQMQAFIIDLADYSQHHLPLIKGNINDLYKTKNQLLTTIIKKLKPEQQETENIDYPHFNLDHRSYEIFIKSLLIKEPAKRIQLLEKARKTIQEGNSQILDFELAKLYFNSGELDTSEKFLEKIAVDKERPNPLLRREKIFLTGLMAHASEDTGSAVEAFTSLLPGNHLGPAVHHNLGVIHLRKKDFAAAEKHFRCALEERKHPETWLNLVHVLLSRGTPRQAAIQLNYALRLYPQKEELVELFSYFISQSQNQALLLPVFQNYNPNLYLVEELPMVSFELENPFNLQVTKPNPAANANESNEIAKNANDLRGLKTKDIDIDSWIERLQELLEINPFEPGYYRLISLLYLKKKEFQQAQLHGLALIFLERTKKNYLHLVKIYKASRNRKKAKEIQKELSSLELE